MRTIDLRLTEFPCTAKGFLEIPFTCPPDVERIEVTYVFPTGATGSVVDIGLARNGRMRGWTGSEYGHVWIAEDRASPGYHPGPLAGEWHVVLGLVRMGENPWVDLQIRLIPRRPRWLVGELHSHSEHSDGGVPMTDALHRARNSGCDFVAVTDHNTTAHNRIRPDDPGLLVIPGMELTSYWGHTNFLGLADPIADWRCYQPADVPRKMHEAREAGATIVINHPFQNSDGGRWQVGMDVPFDAMEIWNGNWAAHNLQAIAFWQELLAAGRRIVVTGGSDFHLKNRRRHGRPANRLYAQTHSVAGILNAVRAGANVVCFAPDETHLIPADGAPMFGETVDAGQTIGLVAEGLSAGDELRLFDQTGCCATLTCPAGRQEIEAPVTGRFLRAEVWRGETPVAFANPHFAG